MFGKHKKTVNDEIAMLDATIRNLTAAYCDAVNRQQYDQANSINTMLTEATAKRSTLINEKYKGGINKSDLVCTVVQGLIAAGGSVGIYMLTRDRIVDKATERTSKGFLDFFRRKSK
jgi:hypothetical protein